MEGAGLHKISLSRFRDMLPKTGSVSFDDDFCLMDLRYDSLESLFLKHPCRLDACLSIYCISGNLTLSVNLTEVELYERTLLVSLPGDILRIQRIDPSQQDSIRLMIVGASKDFMAGLMFDIGKVFSDSVRIINNPCVVLNEDELAVAKQYVLLAENLISRPLSYKKDCIRTLVASSFLFTCSIVAEKANELKHVCGRGKRSKQLFDEFIRLVSEHHAARRQVTFYASEMHLTPKYLSKVIKNTSGHSAPEWITSYVILEAKHLLKYSNLSIKEIVFRLNFPNQSVFYKYFKTHTGMTPNEYRQL